MRACVYLRELKMSSKIKRLLGVDYIVEASLFLAELGEIFTLVLKPRILEEDAVMGSSALADIITSIVNLHQTQHQTLLQLRRDQEQQIKDLLNAQAVDL